MKLEVLRRMILLIPETNAEESHLREVLSERGDDATTIRSLLIRRVTNPHHPPVEGVIIGRESEVNPLPEEVRLGGLPESRRLMLPDRGRTLVTR